MKRRSRDVRNVKDAGGLKSIGPPQLFQGGVVGPIIDDHDFEAGVFESKQGSHTADDRAFFVVRRNNKSDGQGEGRGFHQLQALTAETMAMADVLDDRNDQQSKVNNVG